jgi:hypothetical protein
MATSHLTASRAEESEPLLAAHENDVQVTATTYGTLSGTTEVKQQIGTFSAVFIIFNRIIGTGFVPSRVRIPTLDNRIFHRIFATPSVILNLSGSVGLSMCV